MTRKIDLLVAHCSATRPSQDIGAAEIRRMHRLKGWWDIGYNYVIRRDGTVEAGRPLDKVPAHIGDCGEGMNARSIGVCMVGGVAEDGKTPEANFTPAQLTSLRRQLITLSNQFRIADIDIMGHNDVIRLAREGHWGKRVAAPAKACPSFVFRTWWEHGEVVPFR